MRGIEKEELESERPSISAARAVQFCLDRLYRDKRHVLSDELSYGLTYEELIGALLLARDLIPESALALETSLALVKRQARDIERAALQREAADLMEQVRAAETGEQCVTPLLVRQIEIRRRLEELGAV